jgi:type II secretory pathway pseudopilin PulG
MKIIIAIFILAALVLLVWPALQEGPRAKPNTRVAHELASLRLAAHAYRMEFGQFPTGNVSQVCVALAGHNPRQIIFILFPPEKIQPDGAFLDPWGSPYRIEFPTPTNVIASSAGRDQTWGTDDDIERE